MDESELAELVTAGEQIHTIKLFLAALLFLWIYDYLLTLGDEVKYAWHGKRPWVFTLFIANRYSPLIYIAWSLVILYDYKKPFCQDTKWLSIVYSTLITFLAQTTIGLRVYAVTERNRRLGIVLLSLIVAQLAVGIALTVRAAIRPLQQLPEIDLDVFKLCSTDPWKVGFLLSLNTGVAFDVLSFVSVVLVARKPRPGRYRGIPSILDTILRDAWRYFIILFFFQVLFDLLVIFASEYVWVFPGLALTVLTPLMASRIMLSLKEAASEPVRCRPHFAMSDPNLGTVTEDRNTRFAAKISARPSGVQRTSTALEFATESVELGPLSRSLREEDHPC